jgi:hypothetical protein
MNNDIKINNEYNDIIFTISLLDIVNQSNNNISQLNNYNFKNNKLKYLIYIY